MKEYETLGFYEPGFLHLRINTDSDISDLNKLFKSNQTKKLSSTFLHEYIHFLQEVTSTNGLINGNFYIDFIKDINWKIRANSNKKFKVPVKIDNEFNTKAKIELNEVYRGNHKLTSYVKYDYYEKESTEIIDKDGKSIKPTKYKIHYTDIQTREKKHFYFGHTCLKEQIAHSIQNAYTKTEHPDIPYQIAEQILNIEYPSFGGTNYKFIVALCDSSLMSFHPAQMFFNTIERMKKENFIPKNCKEIYDFAFNELNLIGDMGEFTADSLFEKVIENSIEQYHNALQSPIFSEIYDWLKHILIQAKKLRLENPDFLCNLLDSKGNLSSDFYDIFRKLGSPFYTNNKNEGGFVPPTELINSHSRPFLLLVFKEILRVYSGHKSCSMIDFCRLSPEKDMVNENCIKSPWNKVNESDLCPFAQMWKTWGLTEKKPE